MDTNTLVWTWIAIAGFGFLFSFLTLIDTVSVLRWQKVSKINGARRLLAVGHVRTAFLRTLEFASALGIGGAALAPGRAPRWLGIALLFALVISVCIASFMDWRDRHRLVHVGD